MNRYSRTTMNHVRNTPRFGKIQVRKLVNKALSKNSQCAKVKPFSEIPGPPGLPFIGSLFEALPYIKNHRIVDYFEMQNYKYGPIYRDTIGAYKSVNLFDPQDAETVLRNDGVHPRRIDIDAWKMYREEYNVSKGFLVSNGEEWQRNRSAVNKHMLSPNSMSLYHVGISHVTSDALDVIENRRDTAGHVANFEDVLHRWSLECIGLVLFGVRLGSIDRENNRELEEFVVAIKKMLSLTDKLLALPPELAKALRLGVWKEHTEAWHVIVAYGKKHIDARASADVSTITNTCLLDHLLTNSELSRRDIYGSMIDLLQGAVDTTSVTISWVLYMLACNPEVQSALRDNARALSDTPTDEKTLNKMVIHKQILKETLRFYPVGPVLTRVLDEDIIIRGFHIPAETPINVHLRPMGRNPSLFPDPLSFRPERWSRDRGQDLVQPFSALPFGFGARSCIGKRVAELTICEMMNQICQRYKLTLTDKNEVEADTRTILMPERALPIRFTQM